jgi:basic membrane protein A
MRSTWVIVVVGLALLLGGCARKEGEQAAGAGGEAFEAAFVYVGPIGDGGWTYAHDQGRQHLEKELGAKTTFMENVGEGAEAEQAIRSLARKKLDLVVTTSFGFMDATEAVAAEFPDTKFVHVSGFKSNRSNFANLMGAMESMRYAAGLIAGARAMADGSKILGAVEPFPIAEVIRLLNAFVLGVRSTCPDCQVHIRWINSWFDPVKEKEAAQSLLDAGAGVIVTGADTPGPVVAAAQAGKWGIGYDSANACSAVPDRCLTATYWNWGPIYVRLAKEIREGKFKGGDIYLDVDSGIVGLLGFEEGQQPAPGIPESVIPQVRELLAKMRRGELTRFDIFAGPIRNNVGKLVVPAGARLTQEDLEGLSKLPGRPDCTVCMSWLAEGIVGQIPGQ